MSEKNQRKNLTASIGNNTSQYQNPHSAMTNQENNPLANIAQQSQNMNNATGIPQSQNNSEAATLLSQLGIDDYQFEFASETVVDENLMQAFREFAAQNGMSLENAQQLAKFYEAHSHSMGNQQSRQWQEHESSMRCACQQDEEFGGVKFNENMRYANVAMKRFDDGKLMEILQQSGFGSHPEVVRFMYRVGKSLSEKDAVVGKSYQKKPSVAELFYPSMKKSN